MARENGERMAAAIEQLAAQLQETIDEANATIAVLQARVAQLEDQLQQPPAPVPVPTERWWRVTTPRGVRVRSGPGTGYPDAAPAIPVNTEVRELELREGWVRHADGWSFTTGLMEPFEKQAYDGGPYFDPPVGTLAERRGPEVWPGTWFDATGFATYYTTVGPAYHTGADLNNNSPVWDSDRQAPVYAAADGVVTHAGPLPGTWGNVVVIEHGPSLFTRYAHLHDYNVRAGQAVVRGQEIAHIGNAAGQVAYHLHFDVSVTDVLKTQPHHWPGANEAEVRRHYVDPRTFIQGRRPPNDGPDPREALLPHGRVLVGAGVTDPAPWQLTEPGVAALSEARADAVLLIAPGCTQDVFNRARQANPDIFTVVRMMPGMFPPEEFVANAIADLRVAYANGTRFIQPGNEPNVRIEGYGHLWTSGYTFGQWWVDVVRRLRREFPGAFFGLPCPSPDGQFQGDRAFWVFLEEAERAIREAGERVDWYGLHVYWPAPHSQGQAIQAVRDFAKARPGSFVLVTEFSRQPGTDKQQKGVEYREFVEAQYPGEVKALLGFALQGGPEWENELWVNSAIPHEVGKRSN